MCHQGLLPPEVNSSSNQKTSGLSAIPFVFTQVIASCNLECV